jgi:hypothetical protein
MPANDSYATEIADLRTALASGVLTVESNGRRKTYRSIAEIKSAIDHFEGLAGRPGRRKSRFRAASFTRAQ